MGGKKIRRRKPKVIYSRLRQRGRTNKKADLSRQAMPSGKRRRRTDKTYYKYRRRKTDRPGSMI